jgi:hypothetical protein
MDIVETGMQGTRFKIIEDEDRYPKADLQTQRRLAAAYQRGGRPELKQELAKVKAGTQTHEIATQDPGFTIKSAS